MAPQRPANWHSDMVPIRTAALTDYANATLVENVSKLIGDHPAVGSQANMQHAT